MDRSLTYNPVNIRIVDDISLVVNRLKTLEQINSEGHADT
jgi:hypothetical protein